MANTPDDFRKAEAEIDAELKRKGKKLEERTETEFKNRVRKVFDENFKTKDINAFNDLQKGYQTAISLVPNINYSLQDIAGLCHSISDYDNRHLIWGFFISALINKVIKDGETITIKPKKYVLENNLGVFLERGTLILDGHVGMNAGYGLRGGKLVIRGDTEYCYGNCMEKGELIIEGSVKGPGFNSVKGGKGVIKSIDEKGWHDYGPGDGIGCGQQGGLVEILCDVPTTVKGIGWEQKDGELRVHGNVSCRYINYGQIGGKTHIKGNVIAKGDSVLIGNFKEGGETIIDGDCIETDWGHYKNEIFVGSKQKGGLTLVRGSIHGGIAFDGYPGARIIIEKSVYGNVGDFQTAGTKVIIKGSVTGNVGSTVMDIDCTIDGDVRGNVGFGFGNFSSGKRDGKIEVKGTVYGNVGDNMHFQYLGAFANCQHSWPRIYVGGDVTGTAGDGMRFGEIHVKGRIGQVGESFGGGVYNNGVNVTRIPVKNRFANWLTKKLG